MPGLFQKTKNPPVNTTDDSFLDEIFFRDDEMQAEPNIEELLDYTTVLRKKPKNQQPSAAAEQAESNNQGTKSNNCDKKSLNPKIKEASPSPQSKNSTSTPNITSKQLSPIRTSSKKKLIQSLENIISPSRNSELRAKRKARPNSTSFEHPLTLISSFLSKKKSEFHTSENSCNLSQSSTEASRHTSSSSSYNPRSLEDLPYELQEFLSTSGIPTKLTETEFQVVQTILSFKTKTKFQFTQQAHKDKKAKKKAFTPVLCARAAVQPIKKSDPFLEFTVESYKGTGGYGTVYQAYQKENSSQFVALKGLKSGRTLNRIECDIIPTLSHPNLVKYLNIYESGSELWCTLEYLSGLTLTQYLAQNQPLPEEKIVSFCKDILCGLAYLHNQNLAHRDLKPSNIMLAEDESLKIIDFGLCGDLNKGPMTSICGSSFWIAPEILREECYTEKVDIYSLGVCLMQMANGHLPHASPIMMMFVAATTGFCDAPLESPSHFSNLFLTTVQSCLSLQPFSRPSAESLLKSPLFL